MTERAAHQNEQALIRWWRDPDTRQRLEDLIECSTRCRQLADMGRDNFLSDWIAVSAAERQIEIIGEAAGSIERHVRDDFTGVMWAVVIRMRNSTIHQYGASDDQLTWQTIAVLIPEFVESIGLNTIRR